MALTRVANPIQKWQIENLQLLDEDISVGAGIATSKLADGANFSLTTHKHYQLYQPNGTNPFVYTDNDGKLHIDGDIVQSGSTYDTHAEQVFSTDDYIILRDGAVTGLASGAYSGFEVNLYDGIHNARLAFNNTGIARVGAVGSEQPIATRIESPTNGYIAVWDGSNKRLNFIPDTTYEPSFGTPPGDGYIPIFTGGVRTWVLAGTVGGSGGSDARTYPFYNVSSFTINHGWGVEPNVEVEDEYGFTFTPYSIQRPNLNTVIVTFTSAKSGKVLLTYGAGTGTGGGGTGVGSGNSIAYAYFIN